MDSTLSGVHAWSHRFLCLVDGARIGHRQGALPSRPVSRKLRIGELWEAKRPTPWSGNGNPFNARLARKNKQTTHSLVPGWPPPPPPPPNLHAFQPWPKSQERPKSSWGRRPVDICPWPPTSCSFSAPASRSSILPPPDLDRQTWTQDLLVCGMSGSDVLCKRFYEAYRFIDVCSICFIYIYLSAYVYIQSICFIPENFVCVLYLLRQRMIQA